MASAAVNLVAKKLLREEAQKRLATKQDPYYTTTTSKRGKPIKVRRPDTDVPPGLSPADTKILLKVRRRAYRLDNSMTLPILHTKYGLSSLIGLLPVVGDFADVLLGLTVYNTCRKAGLDKATTSKMLFNIGLDGVLGLVPLLGDVADTLFRCNTRNLVELEKFLTRKGLANLEKMRVTENGEVVLEDMGEGEEVRGSPPPRYQSRERRGNAGAGGRRMESPSGTRQQQQRVRTDSPSGSTHYQQQQRVRTESPTPLPKQQQQQQRVKTGQSLRTNTGRSSHREASGRDSRRRERSEDRAPPVPPRDGSMF